MTEQKIFFITDSACDIPPQEEAQLDNLCILPIPVTADGEGYYERESFTAEEFYDLIERCKEIPVTSHIPSITFQERYEQAWEKGYTHLVVLTIYSGASSMYCYTVGYGYPLMQACKKAQQGAEFEEVVAYIRDYLDRVRIYFSPFTLQYVKKSGRVSCTAAFVGELIGLRPVISAVGTTSVVEKVRGNAAILSSMEKMFAAQRSKKQENAPYMILVARDTPASQELAAACEKIAGYPPVGIYKIGAAITINTGPQIIGLTFLAD